MTMLVAFDIELMRPACPLVAAGLGASIEAAQMLPTKAWVLSPSEGMRVYPTEPAELHQLIEKVETRLSK